jgi:hypothetical protein
MAPTNKEASTKIGVQSKDDLLEAAESLRMYLYLAQKKNLSEALSTSRGSELQNVVTDNLKADRTRGAVETVLTQVRTTTLKDIDNNANGLNVNNSNQGFAVPIENGDFPESISRTLTQLGLASSRTIQRHIAIRSGIDGLNFSNRSSEFVALFANLIPAIEMSKCVPYFNIRFIQVAPNDSKQNPMPFLSLESFVGATKGDTSVNTGGLPNYQAASPVNKPTPRLGGVVTGIELFQAPQTLVRPMLNTDTSYQAQRGIRVLDPMQPLASIESINFDVTALSQNFMSTQTKIDMTIILHDKSRLIELAPLLSPGVYPTVRAEIEWGWSHPAGGGFSNNPYGKFINALRSKQVFCISTVSFSNRDATSLSIKMQLMGLGEFITSNTSTLTGAYVSYELIRARMNQLFAITDVKKKDPKNGGPPTPAMQMFGAHEKVVELSEWESGDKWITYDDYYAISDLITNVSAGRQKIDELIAKYSDIVKNKTRTTVSSSTAPQNLSEFLLSSLRSSILDAKFEDSPYVKGPKKNPTDKTEAQKSPINSPSSIEFLSEIKKIIDNDEAGPASVSVMSLGDAIYRLFTIPMSITDFFDEIRVFTFDFNDHAGNMAGYNIGSFPIPTVNISTNVLKSNVSAQKALQRLVSLVNDPTSAAYGIKDALQEKKEAEEAANKSIVPDDDTTVNAAEVARDEAQAAFEKTLTSIYKKKAQYDLNVSFEPKFTTPRIKVHTEVSSVNEGGSYKQVMNVFIYDEANAGHRNVNLLSSIMQYNSGVARVVTLGPEASKSSSSSKGTLADLFTIQQNPDGTWAISTTREKAKRMITSAIPTLRIGIEGSMITNASYTSSAGGDLSNIQMLKSYKNSGGGSRANASPGINADMYVIPSSLTLQMLGMPLINRGQTYFVDFGTGTTLDNTYTVTSVKHSIKSGQFTTTVNLNVTNQGSIKSVISMLQADLGILQANAKITEKNNLDSALKSAEDALRMSRSR